MRGRGGGLVGALLFVAGLYLAESASLATSLLVAVAVHEAGHLVAFCLVGAPLPRLRVALQGLRLDPRAPLSYRAEAICAVSGPMSNLLAALALSSLSGGAELATVHLLTAAVNLLPITSLDGGRTLKATLARFSSLSRAEAVEEWVSLATLTVMLTLCLGLLWCGGVGGQAYFFFLFLLMEQFSHRRADSLSAEP